MELLINKKYLVRLERYTKFGSGGYYDPFAVRYVFALPKSAGLPDGYTVYIDARRVKWEHDERGLRPFDAKPLYTLELVNGKTYRLTDRPEDAVYVAKMTENREEGKRYKQYKYSDEQLYALYQNVDLATAQLAVAKIDIYLEGQEGNRHKMLYGNRIARTDYYIGKVQGCWFYCSDLDTKRRIGSRGVTVLGNIKADDEASAWELIKQSRKDSKYCKATFSDIFDAKNSVNHALDAVRYFCDREISPENTETLEQVRNIQRAAKSAMQFIEKKLSEKEAALAKINAELEEELKKLFIKEGKRNEKKY